MRPGLLVRKVPLVPPAQPARKDPRALLDLPVPRVLSVPLDPKGRKVRLVPLVRLGLQVRRGLKDRRASPAPLAQSLPLPISTP